MRRIQQPKLVPPAAAVLRGLLILALSFAVGAVHPSVASAAGNCASPINTHLFAGWESRTTQAHEPEGVSATLTYRRADSCQGITIVNGAYSGWVMLSSNGQQLEYAQAGFHFDGNPLSCLKHFSEYNNNFWPLPAEKDGSCVIDGEVHVPAVTYHTGTGGRVTMTIDGVFFAQTSFCICVWAQPFLAFYSGESADVNTDVPGLAASKTDWNNMSIQYINVQTWHDVCNNTILYSTVVPPSRYATDAVACDHDRSWTATP